MSGRGRGRGRSRGQPTNTEPAVDQETGLGQIAQIVADLIAPLAARIDAFVTAVGTPPTPPVPVAPVLDVIAGIAAVS